MNKKIKFLNSIRLLASLISLSTFKMKRKFQNLCSQKSPSEGRAAPPIRWLGYSDHSRHRKFKINACLTHGLWLASLPLKESSPSSNKFLAKIVYSMALPTLIWPWNLTSSLNKLAPNSSNMFLILFSSQSSLHSPLAVRNQLLWGSEGVITMNTS